jgi:single-strand DNA-binding protein
MSSSPTVLIGNATADPELKVLANGTPKLSFSIAVNHFWTDQEGAKQEKTSFFNVVAWRGLAEDAVRVVEKGIRLVITGRLEQRTWEGDDGKKNSIVELIADDIAPSVRGLESIVRYKRSNNGAEGASRPAQAPRKAASSMDDEPF